MNRKDIISVFLEHKVAHNILMMIMIIAGVWALVKLNTQYLPTFDLDIVSVRVNWRGASAEDVEKSITVPLEQEFRGLDNVKKMTSTSANGISSITIEYHEGIDIGMALDQVKEKAAVVRNLPSTAETPEIATVTRYEPIARLLLIGISDISELRHLARRMESELLARGIAKVDITGMPEEEIAIQVPSAILEELGLTLEDIGKQINATSRDLPAGSVGRNDVARQLRSLDQRRSELAFYDIPLISDHNGRLVKVEDIATLTRRPQNGENTISYQGKPALELVLYRTSHQDALKLAHLAKDWLDDIRPHLPPSISLELYDETWQLIKQRIMLLVNSGASGLVIVGIVLYLFLNGWVAWWVAMGIPISLLAALEILYLAGGSINMVTLFAMIMVLGIIVDDAIVVGEEAYSRYQNGDRSNVAAEQGARRMFIPVVAAFLTTVSAFLPLMILGGRMGKILFSIPLVVVCALIASLIECFLILPGHLRDSFRHMPEHGMRQHALRRFLENKFDVFRDQVFRKVVVFCLVNRWLVASTTLSLLILGVGLLASGRMNFTFFPTPESTVILANVSFSSGTPPKRIEHFLNHLEQTLYQTDAQLNARVLRTVVVRHGMSADAESSMVRSGEQFGSLLVELTEPDTRSVRNPEFISAWKKNIQVPAGVESFIITERMGGPPGRDIDIRLSGVDSLQLKTASMELAEVLKTYNGVSAVEDDMPFGREEFIYRLRPEAIALGLTVENVGHQLRAAYDGYLAQIFLDGKDEVEVLVVLPDNERYQMSSLNDLTIRLPKGSGIPLTSAVEFTTQRGFEALRHLRGQLSVQVSASVNKELNNSNKIIEELEKKIFPDLRVRYGLQISLEGRSADQAETMEDMKNGLLMGVVMMYFILAWIFSSYGWPLVVMVAIPFGLIGALLGHLVMNIDLTILSLFGFFGLSGIVVNDSIVLVTCYRQLRDAGKPVREALIDAACLRLRAVLLTSLTTIGGLIPLVMETSFQAQFLIPMAVSICFGLIFSTVLVLLVIPSLLSIYEDMYYKLFSS